MIVIAIGAFYLSFEILLKPDCTHVGSSKVVFGQKSPQKDALIKITLLKITQFRALKFP